MKKSVKPVMRKQPKRPAIFSGEGSRDMWRTINGANTMQELRSALYIVACRCQELESEVERLSDTK